MGAAAALQKHGATIAGLLNQLSGTLTYGDLVWLAVLRSPVVTRLAALLLGIACNGTTTMMRARGVNSMACDLADTDDHIAPLYLLRVVQVSPASRYSP